MLLLFGLFFSSFERVDKGAAYRVHGAAYTTAQFNNASQSDISNNREKPTLRKKPIRYKKRYYIGARPYQHEFLNNAQILVINEVKSFFSGIDPHKYSFYSSFALLRPSYYIFLYLFALF